jgi:hypothetical protein
LSIEKFPLERLLKTAEYLQELSLELDDFLEEKIDKAPEEQLQIITEKHLQLVALTDGKQRDLKTMVSPLDTQFSHTAVTIFTEYVKGIKGNIEVHKGPLKEMITALFGPTKEVSP